MDVQKQTETVTITDEELKSLTEAIQQRHGIDFSCYEPKSLKRRITRALHVLRFQTVHELWVKILRDRSFIYSFMDEISVGLTAMFRDPVLWKRMGHILGNGWSAKKELTVWHAGCSTGEEVYTMSIVTKEARFSGNIRTWATDISNQSMNVARKGEYNLMKIVEYDNNYIEYNPTSTLKRYYTENGGNANIDSTLIKHVTFEYHNLITSPFEKQVDIIFCRNVMIYFDTPAKLMLLEKFYTSLNIGGYFIIGFFDAMSHMIDPRKFALVDEEAKIFQKIG